MIPSKVDQSLHTLALALETRSLSSERLLATFMGHTHHRQGEVTIEQENAIENLTQLLPGLTRSSNSRTSLAELFRTSRGEVLFVWCQSCVDRIDVRMDELLSAALEIDAYVETAPLVARRRLVQGPLIDALSCAPLLGDGSQLAQPEYAEARARLEILIWEAGACALQMPALGRWVFASDVTFEALVATPATGSLRGRVLAARCLEICALGLPDDSKPEMLGRALQILQPLLLHPEPVVSTHAARALGLLAGNTDHLQGMLLDWLGGESLLLRKRAITAAASLPKDKLGTVRQHILSFIHDKDSEGWALAAAANGTPYLFHRNRELWDSIAEKILAGAGGPAAAEALALGLGALFRRGDNRKELELPLRRLRELARKAPKDDLGHWRTYLNVIAITDPVDGAERDPLDLERGLENLVHLASQYDDEEADARAARFASGLGRTFEEARTLALSDAGYRHRAAGMNSLEGCARAMALRLWRPQLLTHPRGEPVPEPDLSEAWDSMAKAPIELLKIITDRRRVREGAALPDDTPLEILAVRLGGYVLDACGEDTGLGPGRGPTAHATCLWLRKLEGIADGSRQLPDELQDALGAVFWRLVDTTRGTVLGAVDDVEWLGPFAAWWALVIDAPEMLARLTNALPMIRPDALKHCAALANQIRSSLESGKENGSWGREARSALKSLHANDTELGQALNSLASCLADFQGVSGRSAGFEALCLKLVLSAERLSTALSDPLRALHPPRTEEVSDALAGKGSENTKRVAALVNRAVCTRELSVLDVWLTSLGPITSGLVEGTIEGAKARTPPPPPSRKSLEPETIEGYELVRPLGEGGIGKVWLVRKPGADRLFVLKIPKVEALASANDTERAGILASFIEEARAMAELYHPNVASIIDRGVSDDVPFLVLELLVGADLKEYAATQLLTLAELPQIVLDSCAGLTALHGVQLVHRDIKPANIWLKLPLSKGEQFQPEKHRDPSITRPLSAAVIDFGMVRPMRVDEDSAGKFVAGTPGYIAPEQVLDPIELDGRADIYALAGTIYNITTRRSFFDDIKNPRDRIFAHMKKQPLEDAGLLKNYPSKLIQLMQAATATDPKDRPFPMEFSREFEACL